MGTLGNQAPRETYEVELERVRSFVRSIKELAREEGVSIEVALEAKRVLELERQNNIRVEDGDYRDEQMGGIGGKLTEIADSISQIADKA